MGGIVALSGYGLMRDDLKNVFYYFHFFVFNIIMTYLLFFLKKKNFSIENKDTLGVIWHGHQDMVKCF